MELGGVRIEVIEGDIARVQADALVNAANNHFWMGGGVAGALKRSGGGNIETEAMSKGPAPVGEAIVTRAGRLAAKYVIHAAVMGQDLETSREAIAKATRSSLERARELGVESIAFPAFGTGVGGFPPAEAAVAMTEATVRFIEEGDAPALKRIVFVLFSGELKEAFETSLAETRWRGSR